MLLKAIYLLFALGAVTGAANVVSRRNPVNVAISLLFTFLCVASLYILHGSPLLAMIQIIVYAGAILILVVFTIMLLSLREPGTGLDDFWTRPQKLAAAAAATILGGQLVYIAYQALDQATPGSGADLRELAAPATLAHVLFDKYLLPFEVASVLLLLAIVGTVVLTRRPKGTAAAIDADHADEIAPPEGGDS